VADVLGAESTVVGGGEHGEDLLVGRAGHGHVGGRWAAVGGAGEAQQRVARGCEVGQLGVHRGELLSERGDLFPELLGVDGGGALAGGDQVKDLLVVHVSAFMRVARTGWRCR